MKKNKRTKQILFDSDIPGRNIEAIGRVLSHVCPDEMQMAAKLLLHAETIRIVATGHAQPAGLYCQALLSDICGDVQVIRHYADVDDGELRRCDAVVAIGGRNDSGDETTENILRYIGRLEIPAIYISEKPAARENNGASVTLCVSGTKDRYSPVPTLTVLEMLCSGLRSSMAS